MNEPLSWCLIGLVVSNLMSVMALAGVRIFKLRPWLDVRRNGKGDDAE